MEKKKYPASPEYMAWGNMKQRCLNPNSSGYKHYGGRGIAIHEGWIKNPESFIEHIGSRPSSVHSVDRIDNNGNYEPGNVKWSTVEEQAKNRRPRPKKAPRQKKGGKPGTKPKQYFCGACGATLSACVWQKHAPRCPGQVNP